MALSTQTQVEQLLQINFGSDTDEACAQYIAFADGLIVSYIGFNPEADAARTETHDPTWTDELWVERPPIRAVTSVTVDGTALSLSDTSGYLWYESGRLLRTGHVWSSDPQGIVVVYDAGYATVPADISFVSASIAARMMQAGASALPEGGSLAGVKSISLDGSDSVSFGDASLDITAVEIMSPMDIMILDPYRRRTAGV